MPLNFQQHIYRPKVDAVAVNGWVAAPSVLILVISNLEPSFYGWHEKYSASIQGAVSEFQCLFLLHGSQLSLVRHSSMP